MKMDDLISFITKEAQHHLINDECTKMVETALAAHSKGNEKWKGAKTKDSKTRKSDPDVTCRNCKKGGHTENNCWSKGGGKEGQ